MKTLIKETETESAPLTVEGLRKAGFTVNVSHFRRVKGQRGTLATKWSIPDRDKIDPKGGATEARVVSPDGREAHATVNVFHKDTYNRRTGIHYALIRALQNLDSQ